MDDAVFPGHLAAWPFGQGIGVDTMLSNLSTSVVHNSERIQKSASFLARSSAILSRFLFFSPNLGANCTYPTRIGSNLLVFWSRSNGRHGWLPCPFSQGWVCLKILSSLSQLFPDYSLPTPSQLGRGERENRF